MLAIPILLTGLLTGLLAGCATPAPDPRLAQATQSQAPPTQLIGASSAVLRAALIPPILRRHDGPADVWLYDSQLCRLEVVLYRGAGGSKLVSLAQPMPASVQLSACMASLQRASLNRTSLNRTSLQRDGTS